MAKKNSSAAIRISVDTRKRLGKLYLKTESGIYLETYEAKIIHLLWVYENDLRGKSASG